MADQISATGRVITISYPEILDKNRDLSAELEAGFGTDSLGIIAISGVPEYLELRQKLLPLASRIAGLPEECKKQLEDPASRQIEGLVLCNPLVDVPTTDNELMQRYPSYCRPSLWPTDTLPELEPAFKELGQLMAEVGLLLAHHCDKFVSSRYSNFQEGSLERMLRRSQCHKGRLLHYFPTSCSDTGETARDMTWWCGWHFDHGSLTGLTCAMYLRDGTTIPNPDIQAGLYIRDRSGTIVKAVFGEADIAYQMGEATEIHSGGLFRATLHCVQAAQSEASVGVNRSTFALFMQPQWDEPLTVPEAGDRLLEKTGGDNSVDVLNFGDFSEKRLSRLRRGLNHRLTRLALEGDPRFPWGTP